MLYEVITIYLSQLLKNWNKFYLIHTSILFYLICSDISLNVKVVIMISDSVKKGVIRTPNRALLKACGYTDEDMEKPFIGVVNSFTRNNFV